ncbi:MAG TPA: DUF4845 domain-containing protein [Burkholderiaceae bacterium]|nr:DUF4845 domain-containing protein [Burkholderiaceae bacterium]
MQKQRGVSLLGLMVIGGIIALGVIVGMQVVPSFAEYQEIKKAVNLAKDAGTTVPEIRASFDRSVQAGYITTLTGKDLDITKDTKGEIVIRFAYEKKLPLFGPVSLVIDYEGSSKTR